MTGKTRALFRLSLTTAMMLLSTAPLLAGPSINVGADHARIVSVAGTPSAVVVGNPMFADVSVQQGVIIVHGRNFGATNVIVLDVDGNQLAAFDVNVTSVGDRNISVFKAWPCLLVGLCAVLPIHAADRRGSAVVQDPERAVRRQGRPVGRGDQARRVGRALKRHPGP